jgi:hypothetical protein
VNIVPKALPLNPASRRVHPLKVLALGICQPVVIAVKLIIPAREYGIVERTYFTYTGGYPLALRD